MEVEAQQKLEQTKQDIDDAVNNPVSSLLLLPAGRTSGNRSCILL